MQIPKTFMLGRKRYRVQFVPTLHRPPGAMGEFDLRTNNIVLAQRSNLTDRVFKREEVSDTFWHEVTHAILKDMKHPQWDDEHFVTGFANRLFKVIRTAEF